MSDSKHVKDLHSEIASVKPEKEIPEPATQKFQNDVHSILASKTKSGVAEQPVQSDNVRVEMNAKSVLPSLSFDRDERTKANELVYALAQKQEVSILRQDGETGSGIDYEDKKLDGELKSELGFMNTDTLKKILPTVNQDLSMLEIKVAVASDPKNPGGPDQVWVAQREPEPRPGDQFYNYHIIGTVKDK